MYLEELGGGGQSRLCACALRRVSAASVRCGLVVGWWLGAHQCGCGCGCALAGGVKQLRLTKLAERRFWEAVHALHLKQFDSAEFRRPWRKQVGLEAEATQLRAAAVGAGVAEFFGQHQAAARSAVDGEEGAEKQPRDTPSEAAAAAAAADGQKYWADVARETISQHKAATEAAEAKAAAAEARLAAALAEAEAAERRRLEAARKEYEPIVLDDAAVLSCVRWVRPISDFRFPISDIVCRRMTHPGHDVDRCRLGPRVCSCVPPVCSCVPRRAGATASDGGGPRCVAAANAELRPARSPRRQR